MLEWPRLLIRAPADESAARADGWMILDPITDTRLGFAGWRQRRGWPARPVLEVYETDDASLLLTMRREGVFGARWRVRDADGRSVGVIMPAASRQRSGDVLISRFGLAFAWIAGAAAQTARRVTDVDGMEIGSLSRSDAGLEVEFAERFGADPFARMVLLAAALRAIA